MREEKRGKRETKKQRLNDITTTNIILKLENVQHGGRIISPRGKLENAKFTAR